MNSAQKKYWQMPSLTVGAKGLSLLLLTACIPAQAATKTWNSTTSTDWFTPGNWTASGVPGSSDTAVINLGASGPVVAAPGATAATVDVGTTATGGTLGVQGGGTISDIGANIGNGASSTGTATVTGTGSSWINSGNILIGSNGTGTLNVQSGAGVSSVT